MAKEIGGVVKKDEYTQVVTTPTAPTTDSYFESPAWRQAVANVQQTYTPPATAARAYQQPTPTYLPPILKAAPTPAARAAAFTPAPYTAARAYEAPVVRQTYTPPAPAARAYERPAVQQAPTYLPPIVKAEPQEQAFFLPGELLPIRKGMAQPLPKVYTPPSPQFAQPKPSTFGEVLKTLASRTKDSVSQFIDEIRASQPDMPEAWRENTYWSAHQGVVPTVPSAPAPSISEVATKALGITYNVWRKTLGSPFRFESMEDTINKAVDAVRETPQLAKEGKWGEIAKKAWSSTSDFIVPAIPIFSQYGVAGRNTAIARANISLTNILPERLLWVSRGQDEKLKEEMPNTWELKTWLGNLLRPEGWTVQSLQRGLQAIPGVFGEQQVGRQLPQIPQLYGTPTHTVGELERAGQQLQQQLPYTTGVYGPPLSSPDKIMGMVQEVRDYLSGNKPGLDAALKPDEWLDLFDEGVIGYSLALHPQGQGGVTIPFLGTIGSDTATNLILINYLGDRTAVLRSLVDKKGLTVEQAAAQLQVPLTEFLMGTAIDLSWLSSIGKVQKGLYSAAYMGLGPLKLELKAVDSALAKTPVGKWLHQLTKQSQLERSFRAKSDALSEFFAQPGTPMERIAQYILDPVNATRTMSDKSAGEVRELFQYMTQNPLFGRTDENDVGSVVDKVYQTWGKQYDDPTAVTGEQMRQLLARAWRAIEIQRLEMFPGDPNRLSTTVKNLGKALVNIAKEAWLGQVAVSLRNNLNTMMTATALDYWSLPDQLDMGGRLKRFMEGIDLNNKPTPVRKVGEYINELLKYVKTTPRVQQLTEAVGTRYGMPVFEYTKQGLATTEAGASQTGKLPFPFVGKPAAMAWWGELRDTIRGKRPTPTLELRDVETVENTEHLWAKLWDKINIAYAQEKIMKSSSDTEQLIRSGAVLKQIENAFPTSKQNLVKVIEQTLREVGIPELDILQVRTAVNSRVHKAADLDELLSQFAEGRKSILRPSDLVDPAITPEVQGSIPYQKMGKAMDEAAVKGQLTPENLTKMRDDYNLELDKRIDSAQRQIAKAKKQVAAMTAEAEMPPDVATKRAALIESARSGITVGLIKGTITSSEQATVEMALNDVVVNGKKLGFVRAQKVAKIMGKLGYTTDQIQTIMQAPIVQKAAQTTLPEVAPQTPPVTQAAAEQVAEQVAAQPTVRDVPDSITSLQRTRLMMKGLSQADIDRMTPEQALDVLGPTARKAPPIRSGIITVTPDGMKGYMKQLVDAELQTPETAQEYLDVGQKMWSQMEKERTDILKTIYADGGKSPSNLAKYNEAYQRMWREEWEPKFARWNEYASMSIRPDTVDFMETVPMDSPIRAALADPATPGNYVSRRNNATWKAFTERSMNRYDLLRKGETFGGADAWALAETSDWMDTNLAMHKVRYDAENNLMGGNPDVAEPTPPLDHPVRNLRASMFSWTGDPVNDEWGATDVVGPRWSEADTARRIELENRAYELQFETADTNFSSRIPINDKDWRARILPLMNYDEQGNFVGLKQGKSTVPDLEGKYRTMELGAGVAHVDEYAAELGMDVNDFLHEVNSVGQMWMKKRLNLAELRDVNWELGVLKAKYTVPEVQQLVPLKAYRETVAAMDDLRAQIAKRTEAGEDTAGMGELLLDYENALEELAKEPEVAAELQRAAVHLGINKLHDHGLQVIKDGQPLLEANKKLYDTISRIKGPLVKQWANTLYNDAVTAVGRAQTYLVDYGIRTQGESLLGYRSPFYLWPIRNLAAWINTAQEVPAFIKAAQRYETISETEIKKHNLPPRFAHTIPFRLPNGTWMGVDLIRTAFSLVPSYIDLMTLEEGGGGWPNQPTTGWKGAAAQVINATSAIGLTPWVFNDIVERRMGLTGDKPMSDLSPYTKYIRMLTNQGERLPEALQKLIPGGDVERIPIIGSKWWTELLAGPQKNIILDYYVREELDRKERLGEISKEAGRLAKVQGMESALYRRVKTEVQQTTDAKAALAAFWPFRSKFMSGEIKAIYDDQQAYYDMTAEAARIVDPKKRAEAYSEAWAFWEKNVESHFETGEKGFAELPMRMREDEFQRRRDELDNAYLKQISAMYKAGTAQRQIKKLEDEYDDKRGKLFDEYKDVVDTWGSTLTGTVSKLYGQLRSQQKYDEADQLLRNLSVEGTPPGQQRERMMWEPEYMGVTYDDFMAYRSRNDTPAEAMVRYLRDEQLSPVWDIVQDKTKTQVEKDAAKAAFNTFDRRVLMERALQLHPEWATDMAALTELSQTRLPTFDELAKVNKTPQQAIQAELLDAIYRTAGGSTRSAAEQKRVRTFFGDALTDALYAKDSKWFEDKKNFAEAQKALAALARTSKLVAEGFPEVAVEGAATVEPSILKATREESYSYIAANAVYGIARAKFGEDFYNEYQAAMKYYGAGGKGPMPPKFKTISAFLKDVRGRLGITYDETAQRYRSTTVPSWFRETMTDADIAQKLGLPTTSKSLVTAQPSAGATPTTTSKPPATTPKVATGTTAKPTTRKAYTPKAATTRRTYTPSYTARKTTTRAYPSAGSTAPGRAGGTISRSTAAERPSLSWSGFTKKAPASLVALLEKQFREGGTVMPDEFAELEKLAREYGWDDTTDFFVALFRSWFGTMKGKGQLDKVSNEAKSFYQEVKDLT